MANMNPDLLRQQSEMMKNMSDEELNRYMQQAKGFMPNMPNLSPEMMRFASQQMNNMSPEQIQNMMRNNPMAQNMAGMNPGGFQRQNSAANPASTNQTQGINRQNTVPNPSTSKPSPQEEKKLNDLQKANKQKDEANQLYKDQKIDKACEKYYEAINTIRFSEKFKNTPEGKQVEIACRLNIALCKTSTGEFDTVIDQCERVLGYEENNWKAAFRMANALYSKGKDEPSNLKRVWEFAEKAFKGNSNDAKVKEFYNMIKSKMDKPQQNPQEESKVNIQQEESKDEPKIQEEVKQSTYAYVPSSNPAQPPSSFVNPANIATMSTEEKAKLVQQNSERIKNMDDSQLNNMIGMMKNNKDMVKNMYKAQGMDLSDEQFEMISNMMTPEMVKSATDMITQNPNLLSQMPQNAQQNRPQSTSFTTQEEVKTNNRQSNPQDIPINQAQAPQMGSQMAGMNGAPYNGNMNDMMRNMMNNPMMQQMMNNPQMMQQIAGMMGGNGSAQSGFNPQAMQDMMQNPSLKGLLANPDFLESALNMMKDPNMKSMIEAQAPGMNVGMMLKALEVLVKMAKWIKSMRQAWSSIYVRLVVFALLVMIVAYFYN